MVFLILKTQIKNREMALLGALFVAGSFAHLRFATENETYIVPVFFSLLGYYFYILSKEQENNIFIFISSLFLSLASLYHQIHFIWLLVIGIFLLLKCIKEKKYVSVAIFIIPILLLPLAYISVLLFYVKQSLTIENLFNFVFYTYTKGTASVYFEFLSISRFCVSLVRTFWQIHPSTFNIIFSFQAFFIASVAIGISTLVILIFFIKSIYPKKMAFNEYQALFILILHLLFALLSFGNSEFMVSMPALATVIFIGQFSFSKKYYGLLSIAMLIYNLAFAILPAHFLLQNSNTKNANIVLQNPKAMFYFKNSSEINNLIQYQTGKSVPNCKFLNTDIDTIDIEIEHLLLRGKKVYTDCANLSRFKNTQNMVYEAKWQKLLSKYQLEKVDSTLVLNEKEYLFEVKI